MDTNQKNGSKRGIDAYKIGSIVTSPFSVRSNDFPVGDGSIRNACAISRFMDRKS